MPRKFWTPEDDAILRTSAPVMGGEDIAQLLGRSHGCVRQRASNLGISIARIEKTFDPVEASKLHLADLEAEYRYRAAALVEG